MKESLRIVSVTENPEYKDITIKYFQSKWSVLPVIYEDCISHAITSTTPLPQWYLLMEGEEIIGSAGLITNDFISRMDLYPWVCGVFIEEKHRGNAYASILLERAKQDTANAGFTHLYLCTDHIGFYEKYGFEYIGQGYHPWGEESRIYGCQVNLRQEEIFPLVNERGEVIGKATRKECHSGTMWLHPVIHLHLFNSKGELYLQKRPMHKDIQPGKWDTAAGGHIDYGEDVETALRREVWEELGITTFTPLYIDSYTFESTVEREYVHTYYTIYDGPVNPNPDELEEGKFWTIEDIRSNIGKEVFTPNFESEFEKVIRSVFK